MRLITACLAAALLPIAARAQPPAEEWQSCTKIVDGVQRLACFDAWSKAQRAPAAEIAAPATPPGEPAPASAAAAPASAPATPTTTTTIAETQAPPPRRGLRLTQSEGCRDTRYSELSRYWELEPGADCGTFGLRGFRPTSLDLAVGSSINPLPTSPNPENNATTPHDFRTTETRLQVSIRTKLAQGLLAARENGLDSLWFAYTQQSYWQLFSPGLSRPFRSTDHEPEFIYVAPLQPAKAGEWRLRFGGLGIVHQSNGQSLPLSRSWNRVYLLAGAEHDRLQLHARIWHRLHEDPANDDNPDITDFIGRGELVATWHQSRTNLFSATARHSLRSPGRGSLRLEWFRTLADPGEGPPSGLQLHTELFTGYGDTLLEYNHKRTVFSVGLSLVEW